MGLIKAEITSLNIHKICRFCLQEKIYCQPLFTTVEFPNCTGIIPAEITHIIQKLTTESVNQRDGLPALICYDCLELVKTSFIFHLIYKESQEILRNYLKERTDVAFLSENSDTDDFKPYVQKSVKVSTTDQKSRKRKRPGCIKQSNGTVKNQSLNLQEENNVDLDCKLLLHSCPICLKEFDASALKIHAHTHKALKKYLKIPKEAKITAGVTFKAKTYDSDRSLFNKTEIKHKCPYCNEKFDVETFRMHVLTHRNQNDYKCQQCERVFRRLNHLNTHLVKHLKEYPYKCEICNKGFVIKTNFDCHILTHKTEELPHECNYCLRRFSNPEHLNRHIIQHTENVTYSVKYKVCKCTHCLKTFKDKNELQNHECKPVDYIIKTRYSCKNCNKVFKQSSGLYNHNRNIHKLKGAKVLCSVCGNYVSNIYNHMLRHSGEKPFECHQCEKRFVAKPQLRQHLLVHSGVKPYVCSICAKAFNNLYNLQVHERIHKGNKCHICQICNKGFLEKSYLKKHLQIHEKVN